MTILDTLRGFAAAYRPADDPVVARLPERPGKRLPALFANHVDGWYNPYVDTIARYRQ